jgi:hypothetical protein
MTTENPFSDSASKPPTSTMNKVYIVFYVDWDAPGIREVFSSENAAKSYIASKDVWAQEYYEIDEYVVHDRNP